MASLQDILRIFLVGIGATAVLDAWLMVLRRLGIPVLRIEFIGRWVGHFQHGRFAHAAIAQSAAVPGERALGWIAHYAIGIAFALLLAGLQGVAWLQAPTPLPAVAVGLVTALVPLCVMQPAMGAGFASSKTPTPLRNTLRSVANHAVFGLGLYVSAVLLARLAA